MPAYIARFHRTEHAEPFHSWAPFAATDEGDARDYALRAIERARATGGTLAEARHVSLVHCRGDDYNLTAQCVTEGVF